jgi:AcrR family transcriptional regulator
MTRISSSAKRTLPDRRVLRTRQSLRGALLQLMVERGWDGIDIASLCERANVGRSTFYLHYPNKEELLRGSFGDLRLALQVEARNAGECPPDQLAFVRGVIAHAHEQQLLFRALVGRRSGHFVQDRFREMLIELVAAEKPAGSRRAWQAQAIAHYLGGALFQLLTWWLSANRPQPPREIEALFHDLSGPVLRAARNAK